MSKVQRPSREGVGYTLISEAVGSLEIRMKIWSKLSRDTKREHQPPIEILNGESLTLPSNPLKTPSQVR